MLKRMEWSREWLNAYKFYFLLDRQKNTFSAHLLVRLEPYDWLLGNDMWEKMLKATSRSGAAMTYENFYMFLLSLIRYQK